MVNKSQYLLIIYPINQLILSTSFHWWQMVESVHLECESAVYNEDRGHCGVTDKWLIDKTASAVFAWRLNEVRVSVWRLKMVHFWNKHIRSDLRLIVKFYRKCIFFLSWFSERCVFSGVKSQRVKSVLHLFPQSLEPYLWLKWIFAKHLSLYISFYLLQTQLTC